MQPDQILKFFADYIEKELGIVYAEHNYYQLQNRLEEIARFMGVGSIASLYETGQKGIYGQFKQLLLDVATNNETSFFRDPKVFKAIESTFLPEFVKAYGPNEKVYIWSAAASTGQEALTLAMVMKGWNEKNKTNLDFSILGTDISERALAKASLGTYSQLEVQRGLPAPLMLEYFKKDKKDLWHASSELMKHIEYQKQNLKGRFSFAKAFHLVLCRNVLIYQSVESKTEILKRLRGTMAPHGTLILGSGESLLGISNDFEYQTFDGAIFYKKKEDRLLVA